MRSSSVETELTIFILGLVSETKTEKQLHEGRATQRFVHQHSESDGRWHDTSDLGISHRI